MKKITLIFISLFFVASCQSTKDAFTLKKKSSTDEFLVEKKNPIVLPPDYGRLPVPQDGEINSYETEDTESDEFQILVDNDNKKSSSTIKKDSTPTSIEKSILEQIE